MEPRFRKDRVYMLFKYLLRTHAPPFRLYYDFGTSCILLAYKERMLV